MLRSQLQPYVASRAPWRLGTQALDNGCQSCAASRLCSEAPVAAVGEHTSARNRHVFAVWHQFGGSGRRQGEGVRPGCRRLSLRRTSCILMANREGASSNPVMTGDPSLSYLQTNQNEAHHEVTSGDQYISTVALPSVVQRNAEFSQFSLVEQAFFLLGFIACTASFALFALIVTAIPTLHAMRRAAMSMEKLADIAREELPGTMAAIRLSGMEISDLTLELNDLSQEISDGVRNSARAVQAAEVGIRRIGAVAASQTFALLQETASVPVQVVRPAVVNAAATTLHAVSQAQKLVFGLASSSYPHISGWLGQKGRPRKEEKSASEVSETTATLTELLAREEILSGSPQLSLFDGAEGAEGTVIPVQATHDN
ncbi:unnamed protein product [Calypogeia fissa]